MTETDVRAELVGLRRTLARLEREAGISPAAGAPPSGYGLVAPGEIIAADHMNRATAQGVMRFASAAARDAAIPVGDRTMNMQSMRDDAPGHQEWWNGSAWSQHPGPWAMSTGSVSFPTIAIPGGGATNIAVTFAIGHFTFAPKLVVSLANGPGGTLYFIPRTSGTTTTGTSIYLYNVGATSQTPNSPVLVEFLAAQGKELGSGLLSEPLPAGSPTAIVVIVCHYEDCENFGIAIQLALPDPPQSGHCGACDRPAPDLTVLRG